MNTEVVIMKKFLAVIFVLCVLSVSQAYAASSAGVGANEALLRLKDGNKRFVHMHLKHPDVSKRRLHDIEFSQHPFVTMLSCSDSRVSPELIFDQGLGDIFEIRNAGNVLDDQVLGSVEYSLVHLGVKLVVVLGHESCGAVAAAYTEAHEDKYIESLTRFIKPSIEKAKYQKGNLLDNASINNAKLGAKEMIRQNPVIADYVKNHGVIVIPAYYCLHTGKVEFLKMD